jgi:arylsulfatase A-like enzyme
MADDMGYGDVGCYNPESKIPTPNMDRLAAAGRRFTDAHAPSAICTPSRYGLLTGRYCWRDPGCGLPVGYYEESIIDADRLTIGEMLGDAGYRTACTGKWHLGMDWPRRENGGQDPDPGDHNIDFTQPFDEGPTERGFDYFFGIRASLDMPPYCFLENDHTVGVPDREKEPYAPQQRDGLMVPDWRDEEVGPRVTEAAMSFLVDHVSHQPDEPFFLYVPTSAPHRPCTPPEFLEGESDAGPRGDMVAEVDWTVGQIDATLDALGVREDTLFIVTSDNGARAECFNGRDYGHSSNGRLRGQKADIWDGGHREPFIARWPGVIDPGTTCEETICLTDVMATCATFAGVDLPHDAAEDSFDVSPALLGESYDGPIRGPLICTSAQGHTAVRRGPWKLIPKLGSGGFTEPANPDPEPGDPEGQLYNLDEDLSEGRNLWDERQDIVEELEGLLQEYREAKTRSAPAR